MTISIIIPSYNQQDFLATAIESALDQTVPSEVIVINDGSTDHSLEIARSFENRGVKVIAQINKGLPSARNTGIMNATGDYVLPLDADDILMENCVERILQVAEQTNADIIAPSFRAFGINTGDAILVKNPTIDVFKKGNSIGYCSAIKRSVLQEVGGYSPRMVWGYEDYALWIDLLKRKKTLVTIQEVLWLYRTKENSMIIEALKHHSDLIMQMMRDNPEVYEPLHP